MGTVIGIALVYVGLSFVFTMWNMYDAGVYRIVVLPFLENGYVLPDNALGEAYWSLVELYTDLAGEDNKLYLTIALFTVGFALVAAGCGSKPSRDLKGGEADPQEYLFTHRPKAFLHCLALPWNILVAAWRLKKAPVILPIIFLPFMLPFALMADIMLAIVFLAARGLMGARIGMAFSKDRDAYERDTQYAVCPKCKRNFYQPKVKCRCGFILSYPVPNKYGVKYHTCNFGHKIQSTNADGVRAKMEAVCPYCGSDIVTHEARPLAISMIGSVGSGKTTMMVSAVESLAVLAKDKGIVCEIMTKGISPNNPRGKANIAPTPAGELDSEYFFLRSRDIFEKQIFINDISGVEFQPDPDKILFEEYYRYNDGIIFAIDPLEVMALYHSQSPTKGSKITPVSVLESFYHMFTEVNGYGPATKSTVPFAIVLTKMDDPRVKSAISEDTSPAEFLNRYGQKMVVDIAQSAFRNVKYFKVASLGENVNAIEPFAWALSESDIELKKKMF
jgi:GTPase SAR1 family protein